MTGRRSPTTTARTALRAVPRQVLGASGLAEDTRAVAVLDAVVHRSRAHAAGIPVARSRTVRSVTVDRFPPAVLPTDREVLL
jgi:hypothetical protein